MTLSPNLAKNGINGGRLTTTSTILSPLLVVPQDGLSREMTPSSPSAAEVFEGKHGTASWIIVGLLIRRALGRSLGEFGSRSSTEIVGSGTLGEGTGLSVVLRSRTTSGGPVHRAISSRKMWNSKRNTPWSSEDLAESRAGTCPRCIDTLRFCSTGSNAKARFECLPSNDLIAA